MLTFLYEREFIWAQIYMGANLYERKSLTQKLR